MGAGVPGSGKTTLLARLVRDLGGSGATCFAHFFEPGTPRREDFELARRSLVAQMISRFDLPASMLSLSLDELVRWVSRQIKPAFPILIVLDNVDGARGIDALDILAPLAKLPTPFVVIASAREDVKVPGVSLANGARMSRASIP